MASIDSAFFQPAFTSVVPTYLSVGDGLKEKVSLLLKRMTSQRVNSLSVTFMDQNDL